METVWKRKISTSPKHALPLISLLSTTHRKKSKESDTETRHFREREPPLPVYIDLNMHRLTRCKRIIQHLHQLEISISYVRVTQLEECERFDEDGVVSLACERSVHCWCLRQPSKSGSFLVTGISLLQFPTENQPGISTQPVTISPSVPRKLSALFHALSGCNITSRFRGKGRLDRHLKRKQKHFPL